MSIHDMTHKAFIAEILSGGVSLHDIETRCKGDAHETDAVFASLLEEQARLQRPANYTPVIAWDGVWHGDDTKWNENPWYQDPNTGEWKRIINFPELARVDDAIIFVQSLMDAATEDTDNAKADADSTKAGTPQPLQGIEAYITATDKGRTLKALHSLLDGKGDTQAAPILAVAVIDGFMTLKGKAFFAVCHKTFGISTPKSGLNRSFHRYVDCNGKQTSENGTLEPSRKALQNALNDIV